jgi:Fic family protein
MTSAAPSPIDANIYRWNGLFSEVLKRTRQTFANDFDQYLLHMTFVEAELARRLAGANIRRRCLAAAAPKGLSAQSVASKTGLPRETARRKLRALVEAGLLHLGPDGLYYLSAPQGLAAFVSHLQPLVDHV